MLGEWRGLAYLGKNCLYVLIFSVQLPEIYTLSPTVSGEEKGTRRIPGGSEILGACVFTASITLSCLRLRSSSSQPAESCPGIHSLIFLSAPMKGRLGGDFSDASWQGPTHPCLRESMWRVWQTGQPGRRWEGLRTGSPPDRQPWPYLCGCQVREGCAHESVDKGNYEGAWNYSLGFGIFTSLISFSSTLKWIFIHFINKYLTSLLFNFYVNWFFIIFHRIISLWLIGN